MKRLVPLLLGAVLVFAGYVGANLLNGKSNALAANAPNTDIITILTKARTAKVFTDEAVADEDLATILKAGINAPSARNSQPWHFSVVRDAEILAEIASSMGGPGGMPAPPPGGQAPPPDRAGGTAFPKLSLTSAKVAIIISGTSNLSTDTFDCGLACQNMSIAAMTLGYATKIVSSPTDAINGAKKDHFHELLGIPEGMNAVAVLLIGVSDERVDAIAGATTRNAFDDVVTYVVR